LTINNTVLDQEVDALVVPLADGWLGIQPGHAAFQARLMRGEVVFRCDDQERMIATLGGTIAVEADRVTLLTGAAAPDRDLPRLEQEISDELAAFQTIESEAEKHVDRIYRQLAETFRRRGRRYA
jgi:F-type H+-transporting ATPase subunit epsilon